MHKPAKPLPIGVVRVEDESAVSPSDSLPVLDLGQIRRWMDFIAGLREGRIQVERAGERTPLRLEVPGVIVTIDFRFSADKSTPPFNAATAAMWAQQSPVLTKVSWSKGLRAKNTGVLIGATLSGFLASSKADVPLVPALHTLAPEETGCDVSNVLLVGQLLAVGGYTLGQKDDDEPFEAAFNHIRELPRTAEAAIIRAMPLLRHQLLRRLGVPGEERDGDIKEPPTLFLVQPDSLLHLLNQFDAADTDEDLDRRLEHAGLEVWTREGKCLCFDLRSLFLDLLEPAPMSRPWGMLPLAVVKSGPARTFVEQINAAVGSSFEAAAAVVQANLPGQKGSTDQIKSCKHPTTRLLALVFAYADEVIRRQGTFNNALARNWDWVEDCEVPDATSPPMRSVLRAMHLVLSYLHEHVRADLVPDDGYYRLTGAGGIATAVYNIMRWERDEIVAREGGNDRSWADLYHVLGYHFDTSVLATYAEEVGDVQGLEEPRRLQVLEHIIGRLQWAGVVDVQTRPVGSAGVERDETSRGKEGDAPRTRVAKFVKVLKGPGLTFSYFSRRVNVDDADVATRLGYAPGKDKDDSGKPEKGKKKPGVTHEIERIITSAECTQDWKVYRDQLASGPLPPHLALAAQWYVRNFYPQLPEEMWPPQCFCFGSAQA